MRPIEKEPGREYKLQQLREHMAGLRSVIKALDFITPNEAGDENILEELMDRRDRFEIAAQIIRRDLRLRTRVPRNLK